MLVVFPVRVRHRDLVRVGEERRGEIVDARRQFQKVVVVVFFAAACASSSSFFVPGAGFGGGGGGGVHRRRRPFVEANFLPFFFFLSFEREKIMAKLFLKKDARESYIYSSHIHKSVPCTRWKRRHRKPGRPSSRANTRTASSSVRTRECPRVRFVVVVVVASRGIF